MKLIIALFQEFILQIKGSSRGLEDCPNISFYLRRFQYKSMLIANTFLFLIFSSFIPYFIYSFNHYHFGYVSSTFFFVFIGFCFLGVAYYSIKFFKIYSNKDFDQTHRSAFFANLSLIILINYFSAYVLNHNNFNFYLIVFSSIYVNIWTLLSTKIRLYFTIVNSILLILSYLYFHSNFGENEAFQITLILQLNFFFWVVGEIFYKIYLVTVDRHLQLISKIAQIKTQKTLIENVLEQQQTSFENLQHSLDMEEDIEEIVQNPLLLSNKINQLIENLNSLKNNLKISKEKFEDIFNNVSDGIMIRDTQWEVSIANPNVDSITGYNFTQGSICSLDSLIIPECKEKYHHYQQQLKEGKKAYFSGEMISNRNKGNVWIEIYSTPILKNNQFLGTRDILRDVTAEKKQWKQNLKNLEKERTYLLNLNHEIRTPLNAIVGVSHLLKESKLQPNLEEMVSMIFHSSNYLKDLVNEILELTNLEMRNYTLQKQSYNFYQENLILFNNFKIEATERNLELQLELSEKLNAHFQLDLVLYSKVFNNLVSNALKYTTEGSIRVQVELLSSSSAETTFAQVTVVDTGIGIEEKDQAKVFDKFQQFHKSQPNQQGIGLGLSICKEIITFLGGEISLQSQYGKGSTFQFSFPISKIALPNETSNEIIQSAHSRR